MCSGGPAIRPFTIEQSRQGFAALERRLRATKHAPAQILVVMEATGSYWLALATALADAGFAVSVINAAQAHHFAKALLKRAKTDAIDARTRVENDLPHVGRQFVHALGKRDRAELQFLAIFGPGDGSVVDFIVAAG